MTIPRITFRLFCALVVCGALLNLNACKSTGGKKGAANAASAKNHGPTLAAGEGQVERFDLNHDETPDVWKIYGDD